MTTIQQLKETKNYQETMIEIQDKVNGGILAEVSGYVEVFKNPKGILQSIDREGIPIAIKNNINVKGWEIDCSSKILSGYVSPYNATVIDKLIQNGFTPYGTTNMDEFAMGSTSATSCHGKTLNPHNENCVPGGSSGGSAAVVASGVAVAALGSDTGGSVRQPAAFCGVVGFKPAYGHVSRNGLIAYSSSLDQIGTLTQNVSDAALLYDTIKGYDPMDSTSLDIEYLSSFDNLDSNKKYKIAYIKDYIDNCEYDLKKSIYNTLELLKNDNHEIIEESLFDTELLLSAYYTIATAEASSNLARFTGVEYGHRSQDFTDLESFYKNNRSEGFGEEVKKRILLGSFVLSSGYYDAYYNQAKKVQRQVKHKFYEIFNKYDLIIMPVAPTTAFEFDKPLTDLQMYLNDIYTISINMAGLPAMSVPIGKDTKGLPTALQIISKNEDEQKIFNTALRIEIIQRM
jgi:aspartyl-tRNA(Asn)/glutamyl-tRNA(Gln) amidotransferase subunit A